MRTITALDFQLASLIEQCLTPKLISDLDIKVDQYDLFVSALATALLLTSTYRCNQLSLVADPLTAFREQRPYLHLERISFL